jgi:hypothetical protein
MFLLLLTPMPLLEPIYTCSCPFHQLRYYFVALMKFSPVHSTRGIPQTAERATVERYDSSIVLTGHGPTTTPANPHCGQETFMDRLLRLDSDTSWAVTQVEITDEGHAIASAIREGKCLSVSDRSFKSKHGTASWVIKAESSANRCTGDNITPGAPSDQSAYRSEVSRLSGIKRIAPLRGSWNWRNCSFPVFRISSLKAQGESHGCCIVRYCIQKARFAAALLRSESLCLDASTRPGRCQGGGRDQFRTAPEC